ncbi:transmembrane protein 208 [Trichonephila clavata]|uniref:Transmembrane protein 208 n=1 Tax=Trichonephila clavata TaxID=2740835 RepID=A0A8X6F9P1_TRICU|nr:transmembrane protein 208 [Trichonephila clavata]
MSFLDPSLESRSTSGNVAFEQQEVLLYTDHAEHMSEEITPDIPCSLDASIQSGCLDASIQSGCLDSSIEKELETPKRNFKRKQTTEKAQDDIDREYLEELRRINASRVNETDPDRMFLLTSIQVLCVISNYFWLLWLLAPVRAFYMLWVNILAPWIFSPSPEIDEKKQKKMERKAKRR